MCLEARRLDVVRSLRPAADADRLSATRSAHRLAPRARRRLAAARPARGSARKLVYAGKVGTGFTDLMLERLEQALLPLRRSESPFRPDPRVWVPRPEGTRGGTRGAHRSGPGAAVFVEPLLVSEVEFTQWTPHGTLRHPSFKGLRNDKDPREVVREDWAPSGGDRATSADGS